MSVKPLNNENELLSKVAAGNQRAFTEIFEFYQRYVYVYGKKLTRSDEQAGEIVQDVFLKLWLNREKLKTIDNFGAYLNRVVRNHSLNILRQLAQSAKANYVVQTQVKEADESTRDQLDYNETNRILNEALNRLPPQQRLVYKLCHVEGMKYEDVAARMNISSRTVQAHMSAALRGIRKHFKEYAIAYPVLMAVLFKL